MTQTEKLEKTLRQALHCLAPDRILAVMRRLTAANDIDREDAWAKMTAAKLAAALALFTPSASGKTALDRLARQSPGDTVAEALTRARLRLCEVGQRSGGGRRAMLDMLTDETLEIIDDVLPDACEGTRVLAWVCPVDEQRFAIIGPLEPLDQDCILIVRTFAQNGRLTPQDRCAEAAYRHIVRYGSPVIAGINAPLPDEAADQDDDLDLIAGAWSRLPAGSKPPPEQIQIVRDLTNTHAVIFALAESVYLREEARAVALSDAWRRIAAVHIETLRSRERVGMRRGMADVEVALAKEIADGRLPQSVRTLLRTLAEPAMARAAQDPALDRLMDRIRALQDKTVEKGCTEAEALAAAEKAAELLDRHGLSLTEVEWSRQVCEGVGIDSGRRRAGPIDDCVQAVGKFFDCRVWIDSGDPIRHIIFGLPADVQAAQILLQMVEQAFETETASFARSPAYAALFGAERRRATMSFRLGLGLGIADKLRVLREARQARVASSSGRDLTVVKADLTEQELALLGIRFGSRSGASRNVMDQEAFLAGSAAAQRFVTEPSLSAA